MGMSGREDLLLTNVEHYVKLPGRIKTRVFPHTHQTHIHIHKREALTLIGSFQKIVFFPTFLI